MLPFILLWGRLKVDKCSVSLPVDNIVSSQTTVFSFEVNINALNVLASAVFIGFLAGFLNIVHSVVFTAALNKEYIFFRSFGFNRGSLLFGSSLCFLCLCSRSFNNGSRLSSGRSSFSLCFFGCNYFFSSW